MAKSSISCPQKVILITSPHLITKKMMETTAGRVKIEAETVAEAYLELLSLRGINCFFGNAGTDFASIVDAFARRLARGKMRPRPITVPHEIPLVGMAQGYYLATGKPQVAMVHVGIGTANGLGGLISASRARVPLLFCAGRTPITEEGEQASRGGFIHWGQESFDQAGMLREYVKWDYELRMPSQLETVVDRALLMSMSEPSGPVYLTFPREILSAPLKDPEVQAEPRYDLPRFYPDPIKIRSAADLLAKASSPLLITSSVGRSASAVKSLVNLAEAGAVAVVSFNPEYMNFPLNHPCHQGFVPDPLIERADLVLVADCDVPWYPKRVKPRDGVRVVQIGIDPFWSRYPIRSFPSDVTLQGDPAYVLSELTSAIIHHPYRDETKLQARMEALEKNHLALLNRWRKDAENAVNLTPLDPHWVSYHVGRILAEDTVVLSEMAIGLREQAFLKAGHYFGTPHAGYLGWALGASLGMKLAAPEKTVIAAMGDGSYMFGVPTASHFVSSAYQIPILIIVYNNQAWNAVRMATLDVHPQGWASKTNQFPLSDLRPSPPFEKICESFGGYGERVEAPEQVEPALKRALHAVRNERRQALLNMVCRHPSVG
jgi:acetolactate synthase-1/2/3 large subunit